LRCRPGRTREERLTDRIHRFACRLPLFVLDHEQRRGDVVWDASWVGGALKLRRSDTDWEIETVEDWIT